MARRGNKRSPLRDHPQYADIVLRIRECIIERRTIDYTRQKLIAAPPDGYGMTGPTGEPISMATTHNYMRLVETMMAKAEAKTNKAARIAKHIATLNHTIALGIDEHGADRAKYAELAKAVRDAVELQARIEGLLGPTTLELNATPNSMYREPPPELQAVLDAATAAQEQLSEDTT